MELDGNTLIVAGVVAAALIGEMRLLRRKLELLLPALIERSRRRDLRRQRRESAATPLPRRRDAHPVAPAESWDDDEGTDLHELIELERQRERTRRQTGRHERKPRPGTHHDH